MATTKATKRTKRHPKAANLDKVFGNGSSKASATAKQSSKRLLRPASRPAKKRTSRTSKKKCIERLILKYEQVRAEAKAMYAEADRIQEDLINLMGIESPAILSDGRTAKIDDNFLDKHGQFKNVSYKPCGVKRFELSVK